MSWDLLIRELDRWAAAGRTATFWWRDDDAVRRSPELDRLIGLARGHGLAPAIAAVPADLEDSLAEALDGLPRVAVLQHGYAHANQAPAGAKKAELGADRPQDRVLAELKSGRERLARAFGRGFLPVLVPPWNRIAPALLPALAGHGWPGLSTYGARRAERPVSGLVQVNTHIDPVDWRRRRFLGLDPALALAIDHLEGRRLGRLDAGEPTGLLTHHLIQDAETWAFLEAFVRLTQGHPAARWLAAGEVFADATAVAA